MPRKPRTIVLCFDGTSNEYGTTNTNVIKLNALLEKHDMEEQVVYYQAGIGTYFDPGVVKPAFAWLAKILDEAVAWYLEAHVMGGYKFLMQNFNTGDRVCLFGFSRGAYTARALAGMLHKVGLLSKDNGEQVSFAYKIYKSHKPSDVLLAQGFKKTFCRDVPIEFLGVWDTVASVGLLAGRTLPFVSSNKAIKTFRHALSLDEHRGKFRPSFYIHSSPNSTDPTMRPPTLIGDVTKFLKTYLPFINEQESKMALLLENFNRGKDEESDVNPTAAHYVTDVKEVWFAGCHSDVGGGSTPDSDEYALSNIPLRWMIRQVMRAQCGIVFDTAAVKKLGMAIGATESTGKDSQSMNGDVTSNGSGKAANGTQNHQNGGGRLMTEEERTARDAVQAIHDPLKTTPIWWLLEIVPTHYTYQNMKTHEWVREFSFHLGRGRFVPEPAEFHESVKQRMDDAALKYKPRAQFERSSITFVS